MQKNANETAKETKNMFLQSAKELKAVTTLAAVLVRQPDQERHIRPHNRSLHSPQLRPGLDRVHRLPKMMVGLAAGMMPVRFGAQIDGHGGGNRSAPPR